MMADRITSVWRCDQCNRLFDDAVMENVRQIRKPTPGFGSASPYSYNTVALCDDCVAAVVQPKDK